MNKIPRQKFISLTGGRSLFCLHIDYSGEQQAAVTDYFAKIRPIPIKEELTAETLPKIVAYLKVRSYSSVT